MTKISLIAAMDENRGIGKDNHLLCHLPADLKHFKELTLGKPIIMGRKTYQSIGKPLPGRLNIVLSREIKSIEGVVVVSSLQQALIAAAGAEEVMIIGGAVIFKEALPLAECIYITIIHAQLDADVYFPHIKNTEWVCGEELHRLPDETNKYRMTFVRYERIKN